jgi:hypothetical protein
MTDEALYKEGKLSVADIARNQGISKATLYSYLRHCGVQIGAYKKPPPVFVDAPWVGRAYCWALRAAIQADTWS